MTSYLHTRYRITDPERSRAFTRLWASTFSRDIDIVRRVPASRQAIGYRPAALTSTDFPWYVRGVTLRLSTSSLEAIERGGIPVPHYDRAALTPRILHIGVGGFHRAHMALYVDELAEAGGGWGIRGIGLLDADRRIASVLESQDHLYTLIERDSNGSRPRIVGSIVDYRLVADDAAAFAREVARPEIEILSMTITEGGYSLDKPNPTIEAIVTGLDARRASGGSPLTILSCDNLPGNGNVAREAVTRVCEARSDDLVRWVETACSFPNSMVDRITPQTTDADRAFLRDECGLDDGWPVVSEPFRQWVLEDSFAAGRPAWEEVGALFTDRVHDWELYKLRMLNATHSCMAYLMAIAGVVYVDEAVATPGSEAIPRAVPFSRGDTDAHRDSWPSRCGLRPHRARPVREHGRARPDRTPLHRRDGEVPELPHPDDRATARARWAGRVRSACARGLGPLSRDGAGRRASERPVR